MGKSNAITVAPSAVRWPTSPSSGGRVGLMSHACRGRSAGDDACSPFRAVRGGVASRGATRPALEVGGT